MCASVSAMNFRYSGTQGGHPVQGEVADGKITGPPPVTTLVETLVKLGAHVGEGNVSGPASLTNPRLAQITVAAALDEGTARFSGDRPPRDEIPADAVA